MLEARAEKDILTACKVLFGPEVAVTREFLQILYPGGIKAAFRCRARETHPDLQAAAAVGYSSVTDFHKVTAAYSQLSQYCQHRSLREAGRHSRFPATAKKTTTKYRQNVSPGNGTHGGVYYRGEVPQRKLMLGRFLYFRKIIPYNLLLASLAWQRQQRPSIGQLARNWGWLRTEEVLHILSTASVAGRFGEKALQLDLLTDRQVTMLLNCQRQRQRRLGEYFVEHGYLSPRQLERFLLELAEHNAQRY